MAHLSLSQIFLVLVPKPTVSLQPASPLSPPLSPPPQHLVGLQPAIILALSELITTNYPILDPIPTVMPNLDPIVIHIWIGTSEATWTRGCLYCI